MKAEINKKWQNALENNQDKLSYLIWPVGVTGLDVILAGLGLGVGGMGMGVDVGVHGGMDGLVVEAAEG